MIASVSDTGTLELFWRHPVSKHAEREASAHFVSQLRHSRDSLRVLQDFLNRERWKISIGGDTYNQFLRLIACGECIVLQHQSELRWHGTRTPIAALSRSVLLLSKARTVPSRNLHAGLTWVRERASSADLELLWKQLFIGYRRMMVPVLPPLGEFTFEIEKLLKTGELVPVFHPLPIYAETVVAGMPAGVDGSARSGPAAPPPDPRTFDPDHAVASQVRALQAAAETGVPFCEVCQQAAASRGSR